MTRNIRIVPAILTDDPEALKQMIRQTESFTDYAQIDIMDGQFVPSKSIICDQITGLAAKLRWEAHLMVMKPENCAEAFQKAGAEMVVFHYEATPSPREVIAVIKKLGIKAGMAINPETPISVVEPLADELDNILFLSVNPGYYGSKFIPEVLEKIVSFRKMYPDMEIAIDGGIKEGNVAEAARTGVDVICVGSAIYHQDDPGACFRHLQSLAEANAP